MMNKIFGGWGASAVSIAAMISIFAALNGSILSGSRVPYAAARDGYFFEAVGRVVTLDETLLDAVTGLSAAPALAYTDLAVIARFNSTGTIDSINGGGYAATNTVPYAGGSTYHFRAAVNVSNHSYSLYVIPPGTPETPIALNYAFRTGQTGVTALSNWAVTATTGSQNYLHTFAGDGEYWYHCLLHTTAHYREGGVVFVNSSGGDSAFVRIFQGKFDPESVTVRAGAQVRWQNFDDGTSHSVTSD